MTSHICIYCRTRISLKGKISYLCSNCESVVRKEQRVEGFNYLSGDYN